MAKKDKRRNNSPELYTYRAGKRLNLCKRSDEFVVRCSPEELPPGLDKGELVSPASTLVTVAPEKVDQAMERARRQAVAHHAYQVAETGEAFLITDRIIIEFARDLTPLEVGEFAGRYGLTIAEQYAPRQYLFRLTSATGMNPVKLVVKLSEEDADVKFAEHDLNMRFSRSLELPADRRYRDQWHLHRRLQHPEVDPRSSARCEGAWELLGGFGDRGVVIGITDDGCRLDHPDFASPGKFAAWGYFQGSRLVRWGEPDALPERMYQVGANHGTACAGVAAADTDAALTVGAAPNCRLLPIKWQSDQSSLFISDSKMMTALGYLADQVDVISNSWGSSPTALWSQIVLNRIAELAREGGRRGRGILFLFAAGNENCPIQHTAPVDVPYTSGWAAVGGSVEWVGVRTARRFVHNIVGIHGVLQVAALASTAQRSHYSNYGPGIDLCAPSSNSHTYFRMPVEGLGIVTTTGGLTLVREDFGGTSSATPLVAGISALAISANPEITAFELASVLRRTASKELEMTAYPRTPPALYDPDPTWDVSPIAPFDRGDFDDVGVDDGTWSPWFGHGKVDALAALREVSAAARQAGGARSRRSPARSGRSKRSVKEPSAK